MLHQKISHEGATEVALDGKIEGERRHGSERYMTMLKVGRAVVDGQDQLCLVRNMSCEGAKLDIYHDVEQGQKITIELRSDKVVTGTVRWVGDHAAGIEFDSPVDVSDMLQQRPQRSVLRKLPRSPRFVAQAHAHLQHDKGQSISGELVNVSLHGLCIETVDDARVDDHMIARIEGLPPRSATVRWVREGMVGLHFDMPMSFSELARWLENHQRRD